MRSDTIIKLLKTCAQKKDLYEGNRIHGDLIISGGNSFAKSISIGNTLINMYAKCGAIGKAQEVFDELKDRDVISWNSLISGYAHQGHGQEALNCFGRMQLCGLSPDGFTYVGILKACGIVKDAINGQEFHLGIAKYGLLERNNVVGNALVDMYVKCGLILEAQDVFDKLPVRDVVTWNVLIAGYIRYDFTLEALKCYDRMEVDGISPDAYTFAFVLKACGTMGDLNKGQEIHAHSQKNTTMEKNVVVGNALMDMYVKCDALAKAKEVFDMVKIRNTVSWNVMIGGYVKHGHDKEALDYFEQMQLMSVPPNQITFVCVLKACGSTRDSDKGQEIHAQIVKEKLMENDMILSNAVVDMYAKCGLLGKAGNVFNQLPLRNTSTWNVLISGYVKHGYIEEALDLLDQMHSEGFSPNDITFLFLLKVCGTRAAIDKGQDLHAMIVREGWIEKHNNIGSALIHMYMKCGSLLEAQKVFDKLQVRDVVSWTALIAGYAEHMHVNEALHYSEQLQRLNISLDSINFACLLKTYGSIGAIDKGQGLHSKLVKEGLLGRSIVAHTALIDMYGNCGMLMEAQVLFDKLPVRDLVLWNLLISGYIQKEDGEEALSCFEQMQSSGVSPDVTTFIYILKACGKIGALEKGHKIHCEFLKQGFVEKYPVLGTVLVDMYAKCGSIEKAEKVFHELPVWDVIAWNAFISGYSRHGLDKAVLNCFELMQLVGNTPDVATFVCILKVCCNTGDSNKGQGIHAEIIKQGLLEKSDDVADALLEMYAKCDMFEEAKEVFDTMQNPCTTSWNVLIAGYSQHGHNKEIQKCFEQMQSSGFSPDTFTYIFILKTYSSVIGITEKSQEIHAQIVKLGFLEACNVLGNVLVDMYAKYGLLAEARKVFEILLVQDVISWNVLISGYIQHGKNQEAINCFYWMQAGSYLPDAFTFACILKACGSIGIIGKRKALHAQTIVDHLLGKDVVIGNALVDMYAKCGALVEAQIVFNKLETRDTISWNILISGYCVHGNNEEALTHFEHMEMDKISPDVPTFLTVLKVCGNLGEAYKGQKIHVRVVMEGFLEGNDILSSALVDMYVKCGMLCEAKDIVKKLQFSDIVVWNSLIAGYIQCKLTQRAFYCFEQIQLEGHSPNVVTFICILKACGNEGAVEIGKAVHAKIIYSNLENENLISKALIDMYSKCGMIAEAQGLFHTFSSRDLVTWHILITGYSQLGKDEIVFMLFQQMINHGEEPNLATLAILLTTCIHTGLLEEGQLCLDVLRRVYGIIPSLEHLTCMIDLFSRAGCLDKAIMLIKVMPFSPNLLVWNTMLGACWKLGDLQLGRLVFEYTLQFDEDDGATYVCMSNIYAAQSSTI